MRTLCAVLAALTLAACHPAPRPAPAPTVHADSLVLERSLCFGVCPAYRLSLRADGTVTFVSRNPRDTTRTASSSIEPAQFESLLHEAERIHFFSLPPAIMNDSTLCPVAATDHPTATVTIFQPDSVHRVVDYLGCYAGNDLSAAAPVAALRQFEKQIDSVTQSWRWVRPASRR